MYSVAARFLLSMPRRSRWEAMSIWNDWHEELQCFLVQILQPSSTKLQLSRRWPRRNRSRWPTWKMRVTKFDSVGQTRAERSRKKNASQLHITKQVTRFCKCFSRTQIHFTKSQSSHVVKRWAQHSVFQKRIDTVIPADTCLQRCVFCVEVVSQKSAKPVIFQAVRRWISAWQLHSHERWFCNGECLIDWAL